MKLLLHNDAAKIWSFISKAPCLSPSTIVKLLVDERAKQQVGTEPTSSWSSRIYYWEKTTKWNSQDKMVKYRKGLFPWVKRNGCDYQVRFDCHSFHFGNKILNGSTVIFTNSTAWKARWRTRTLEYPTSTTYYRTFRRTELSEKFWR